LEIPRTELEIRTVEVFWIDESWKIVLQKCQKKFKFYKKKKIGCYLLRRIVGHNLVKSVVQSALKIVSHVYSMRPEEVRLQLPCFVSELLRRRPTLHPYFRLFNSKSSRLRYDQVVVHTVALLRLQCRTRYSFVSHLIPHDDSVAFTDWTISLKPQTPPNHSRRLRLFPSDSDRTIRTTRWNLRQQVMRIKARHFFTTTCEHWMYTHTFHQWWRSICNRCIHFKC